MVDPPRVETGGRIAPPGNRTGPGHLDFREDFEDLSTEEALGEKIPGDESLALGTLADLEEYLDRIPDIEQDIWHLRRAGMTQWQIGKLLGVTQAAVSYRLRRMVHRLHLLRTRPELSKDEVRDALVICPSKLQKRTPEEWQIVASCWHEMGFAEGARRLDWDPPIKDAGPHSRTVYEAATCRLLASSDDFAAGVGWRLAWLLVPGRAGKLSSMVKVREVVAEIR